MLKTRVIPSLLLHNGGLFKTIRFKNPTYIGDPINAIKIFNDKEVDELVIFDIDGTRRGNIDFRLLNRINKEAFMPMGYGGGISSTDDIKNILNIGYEKIILNSIALENGNIIEEAASACGSQSVVVCIDVKKNSFGRFFVYSHVRKRVTDLDPVSYAIKVEKMGAGELIINSVDKDGTFSGYELEVIKNIAEAVTIPVVALGGAGNTNDFVQAVKIGRASAVSAGSMFVFIGPHRAVLITYPDKQQLKNLLDK